MTFLVMSVSLLLNFFPLFHFINTVTIPFSQAKFIQLQLSPANTVVGQLYHCLFCPLFTLLTSIIWSYKFKIKRLLSAVRNTGLSGSRFPCFMFYFCSKDHKLRKIQSAQFSKIPQSLHFVSWILFTVRFQNFFFPLGILLQTENVSTA